MKLASFSYHGRDSFGVVVGDGIVDAGRRLRERFPTLRSAIAGNAMADIARIAKEPADIKLGEANSCRRFQTPTRLSASG